MTYSSGVPAQLASPGIFPAQGNTNFARLQTIIGGDHQFNLSAAANDGYHNLIHLTAQAPSGALAATGRLYVKTAGSYLQLFYMDEAGRAYQITPGIIAAVNFNGTGAVGVQTLRSSINVTSVTKTSTGSYTIAFTTAIANNNYIVQCTGMRNATGDVSNGYIAGNATYGTSVAVGSLKVEFNGGSSSLQDVLMGNVIIYSAS